MSFVHAAEFNKVDFNRQEEYFSLQCVEHPKLFLALNDDDQFTVRGMVSFHSVCSVCAHPPSKVDKK